MNTRLVILIVVCCAIAANADNYGRTYNACKGSIQTLLDKPTGQTKCKMISGLSSLSVNASLTVTQNTTYQTWLTTMDTTIISNASIVSTKDKLNMCAASFKNFSMANPDIYSKIKYFNISTWGSVDTVIRVTNEWNMQGSLELIVAIDVKGNCKLFDSLLAACKNDGPKNMALKAFIESDLKPIIKMKKSQPDTIQAIKKALMTKFFTVPGRETWMATFSAYQLNGFFAFSQWFEVAATFEKQAALNATMSGDGMNCPFILALNATLSSPNYTTTQKGYIKQFMNACIQGFSTTITVSARIDFLMVQFSASINLSQSYFSLLGGIPCPGFGDGNFFDIIIIGGCQATTIPKDCGCPMPTFNMMNMTTMMPTTEMASTTPKCMCSCEM